MTKNKVKTRKEYLLASFTIIVTFMVAVWQELIKRFPMNDFSLASFAFALIFAFLLTIRLYKNPKIKPKSDKKSLLLAILSILFVFFAFFFNFYFGTR